MPEASSVFNFDNLTVVELEAKRRDLVDKARRAAAEQGVEKAWDALSVEELTVLSALTAQLRRRSGGPPKAKKEKTARSASTKISVTDAMDLI